MTNHPLTDEIIEEIEMKSGGPCERCNNNMNMRAAADWQLEECVKELERLLTIFGVTGVMREEIIPIVVALFSFNMRPQQQEDN